MPKSLAPSAPAAAKVPLGKVPVEEMATSSEDDIFALPKKNTPEPPPTVILLL